MAWGRLSSCFLSFNVCVFKLFFAPWRTRNFLFAFALQGSPRFYKTCFKGSKEKREQPDFPGGASARSCPQRLHGSPEQRLRRGLPPAPRPASLPEGAGNSSQARKDLDVEGSHVWIYRTRCDLGRGLGE